MRRYLKPKAGIKPEIMLEIPSVLSFPLDEKLDSATAIAIDIKSKLKEEYDNIRNGFLKFLTQLKKELKDKNVRKDLNSSRDEYVYFDYERRIHKLVDSINKSNLFLTLEIGNVTVTREKEVHGKIIIVFSKLYKLSVRRTNQRVILDDDELESKLDTINSIADVFQPIEYDAFKELIQRTSLLPTLFKSKDYRHFNRFEMKDISDVVTKGGYTRHLSYTSLGTGQFNYYLGFIVYSIASLIGSMNESFDEIRKDITEIFNVTLPE